MTGPAGIPVTDAELTANRLAGLPDDWMPRSKRDQAGDRFGGVDALSIFAPDPEMPWAEYRALIMERLDVIDQHDCDCDELPHDNGLHDLRSEDVPELIRPRPDGNLAIYRDTSGQLRCRVVTRDNPIEPYERPGMPHAATCTGKPDDKPAVTREGAVVLADARQRRKARERQKAI